MSSGSPELARSGSIPYLTLQALQIINKEIQDGPFYPQVHFRTTEDLFAVQREMTAIGMSQIRLQKMRPKCTAS